ncbi:hypothetical protein [Paraburkholderia fungorum]|uniref:hypothetical protein n=1 Tax=Paraburkholderia fungorum TaxID=134537 RepID=UPI003D6BFF84
MAKKMISMKFEAEFLERLDAAARVDGVDRTTYVTRATEAAISGAKIVSGAIVIDPKPSPKREPTENALKRQVGFEHHAKQTEPVDVSKLAVAGWRENMAAPGSRLKPGKGSKK